jgi:hypothetical protein
MFRDQRGSDPVSAFQKARPHDGVNLQAQPMIFPVNSLWSMVLVPPPVPQQRFTNGARTYRIMKRDPPRLPIREIQSAGSIRMVPPKKAFRSSTEHSAPSIRRRPAYPTVSAAAFCAFASSCSSPCDTQLLVACLHAYECGGRSRPEAVRGHARGTNHPPSHWGPGGVDGCRLGQPSLVLHHGVVSAFAWGFVLFSSDFGVGTSQDLGN